MQCRFCNTGLNNIFIDLHNAPPSNSFLKPEQLNEAEVFFPLKVFVCHSCFLVQIDEYKKSEEIFNKEYHYFSSYSKSWLNHAKDYVEEMTEQLRLNEESLVIEIASNDGYLLQYFKEKNIPAIGIEPSANTASVAISRGIETVTDFFGLNLANNLKKAGKVADLLLGKNVLAHVPDISDFVKALKIVLATEGVVTMEFPHLLQLVSNNQFDTIYHEHYSYLSLYTVHKIFDSCGLKIIDVKEFDTHGGSLRIYATHSESNKLPSNEVNRVLENEIKAGINTLSFYEGFQNKAEELKFQLLEFLLKCKRDNKSVAAYGAAAKGNTLLNFCGIKPDLISFIVDANPFKQGKYLPGSHIPVVNEEMIKKEKPDFIIIFPWNLKNELFSQLGYIKEWNGSFVLPVPELEIIKP